MTLASLVCVAFIAAPDANAILTEVDAAASRAKDTTMTLQIDVSQGDAAPLSRTLKVWQLGRDRRMVKFVAPARLKGTGILSVEGKTSLYSRAYDRVRRVSGKAGGGDWMGTGFSINDLARVRFSDDYTPTLARETAESWVLNLTPKDAAAHRHAGLRITVRKKDHLVALIETLDSAGKVLRRIAADEFKPDAAGKYTVAHRFRIEDLQSGKRTVARLSGVNFDSGLDSGFFTERQLKRAP